MFLSQENTLSSLDAYYAACIIILFAPMHQIARFSPSQINDYLTTILPRQGLKNSIQSFVVPVCWMENVLRSKKIRKSILFKPVEGNINTLGTISFPRTTVNGIKTHFFSFSDFRHIIYKSDFFLIIYKFFQIRYPICQKYPPPK